jgi:hypothetical protein
VISRSKNSDITLLGTGEKLKYQQEKENLSVIIPKIKNDYTIILKISPVPENLSI